MDRGVAVRPLPGSPATNTAHPRPSATMPAKSRTLRSPVNARHSGARGTSQRRLPSLSPDEGNGTLGGAKYTSSGGRVGWHDGRGRVDDTEASRPLLAWLTRSQVRRTSGAGA